MQVAVIHLNLKQKQDQGVKLNRNSEIFCKQEQGLTREHHWLHRLIGPRPKRFVETDFETGSGAQAQTRAATEPTSEQ